MANNSGFTHLVEKHTPKREFPHRLAELVELFGSNRAAYRDKNYKEMEVRAEFLNPLLEELGWDPTNKNGSEYSSREVIHEDIVSVDGASKAPDYALLINGTRKFFMEAKRPSVDIASHIAPALQIRRYCWSAGLPFGLVTDFEEFAIYDCRAIPSETDSTHVGRLAYFTFDQLEENWHLLDGMFGRHNVEQGILELLSTEAKAPAGTRPIDLAFLDEIRSWRVNLASDVALLNPELEGEDIATSVQKLIDRVIFLRIAEARGLESEGELKSAAESEGGNIYQTLLKLFKRADDRYNSGLFHVTGSESAPEFDSIGYRLQVSDSILKTILTRMYFPEPYEFSVMPADILGRIYEQFLGEQIIVHQDRSTSVELKIEYRKSGGVYYTPAPVVDFMVETTLSPLLTGKTPSQLRKEGFAVVDPSSGSGSFLISAYQFLLDWYRDQYISKQETNKKFLELGTDRQLRLKTSERKRILIDHIFGVDIDRQAVEVTKLSLLLKVIEKQAQQEFAIGHILPDLDKNILCGNSLIDHDFLEPLYSETESEINEFSWEQGFPEVFKRGGFEAVIGNPPYLNVDASWGKNDPRLSYLKSAYSDIHTDKTDLLFYFLKKSVSISRGEVALIVSRSFLEADKAKKLRKWLSSNARVRSVLDFRHALVFPKVGINTAIIRMTKSTSVKKSKFLQFLDQALRPGYDASYLKNPENYNEIEIPSVELDEGPWNFGDTNVRKILAKMDASGDQIGDILSIGQGMQTGDNKAFQFTPEPQKVESLKSQGLLYERIRNSDIQQYFLRHSGVHIIYPENASSFEKLPPEMREHLEENQETLKQRAAFIRGNCEWWRFTWPLHKEYFSRSRIFCPYRASNNRFALDESKEFLGLTDTTVLYDNGQSEDMRYILGLLNTKILTARFRFIGKLLGGGVFEYYENTVRKLPIPRLNPGQESHDKIVQLVSEIEDATNDLLTSVVPAEREVAESRISEAQNEIEDIATKLFGLSESERELLISQLD